MDVSPSGASSLEFGVFPEFELVSQEGKVVTKADLLGRPFFACAVFTNCTGPCPGITSQMQALQTELEDLDVLLVTVTVDPEHDTSEVLGKYASKYDADPERWLFLTGGEKEIDEFVRKAFYLAVDRAGDEITHDTRIIAIDAEGRRRGWYDGTDVKAVQRLRGRMAALAAEAQAE